MTHRRLSAFVLTTVLFALPAFAQAAPPKTPAKATDHTHQMQHQPKESKHAKSHAAPPSVSSKPATQPKGGKSPH